MEPVTILLGTVALVAAGAAAWIWVDRRRLLAAAAGTDARAQRAEAAAMEQRLAAERATVELARVSEQLSAERRAHEESVKAAERIAAERIAALELAKREIEARAREFQEQAQAAFRSHAATAFEASAKSLLKLAEEGFKSQQAIGQAEIEKRKVEVERLVGPIAETLKQTDEKLGQINKEWTADRAGLVEQLRQVGVSSESLRSETGRLVRALREPHVRGRYGEMQLKRIAELAGMSAQCDFEVQHQTADADGRPLRPDMVVRLPNDRCIVVDAKANLKPYLDALQAATPQEGEECLERFARHVADTAAALAKKRYYAQYDGSPEFVVMFLPGDQFLDAALTRQPDLLENAARQNVLLASPATLIGLLRAVAVAFREQRLAVEAAELRDLGRKLHEHASRAFEHVQKLGKALEGAVDRYNEFCGSYQRNMEPTLRKFEAAGVKGAKELPEVSEVTVRPRLVSVSARAGEDPQA